MHLNVTNYLRAGVGIVALLVFTITFSCGQQSQRQPGRIISAEQAENEWRGLGRDLAFTRYSPLDQINAEN